MDDAGNAPKESAGAPAARDPERAARIAREAEHGAYEFRLEDAKPFVRGLYKAVLGRRPDLAGLDTYAGQLVSGTTPRSLLTTFLVSPEHNRKGGLVELATRLAALIPRTSRFDPNYMPPGEAGRTYVERVNTGFLDRYCPGPTILDVGFSGYDNPERLTALPGAIGIDLDYPGYDGLHLPFADGSVDTIFSSHCLEHIPDDVAAVADWFRVLRVGGFIVCMVPSQALYEKKRDMPSFWNQDHKRMYTPSSLLAVFERALAVNSYRIRHFRENDTGFNYARGPELHSDGAYELEVVVEKIAPPNWTLA